MKPPIPTERQVQRAILEMMGHCFKRVLVWHVPNGAFLGDNVQARKRTMGMLLGDGLKPGAPDLACYWHGGHALMEVKRPGYSPSNISLQQTVIHQQLAEMDWPVGIVTTPKEAFDFLVERGAPTNITQYQEDRAA